MKNQKLLTVATLAGLTLGGLTAGSVAAAQSYGDDPVAAETSDSSDSTVDVELDDGGIILVQETEDDAEVDGDEVDGERGERRGHRGGCDLDEAAEAIGIDEAELRTAIENGDTIADVAAANGVDADVVIDAMVDAKAERIAEKVEEGRLTQAEADEKLADVETRIEDRVNGVEEAPQA